MWFASLSACQPAMAQPEPAYREYADILKAVPQQDFLKLRGSHKEETAMELSKVLSAELQKIDTYRLKVDKVETWPFAQEGITGWRIHGNDEKVKVGSLSIAVEVFVYVRTDPTGLMPKMKRGQTVLATGTVTRCDIMAKDSPVLTVDVNATGVTAK
jgi:hypothetical protein